MPNQLHEQLLRYLRGFGPASAADLARALGVSQPTISRLLSAVGSDVVRIGKARNTRYVLRKNIGPLSATQPVYRINSEGTCRQIGELIVGHGCWLFNQEVHPDLPWFLNDMRPQGFLGRLIARRLSTEHALDPDPRYWSGEDVLHYLVRYGSDEIGDLVVGAEMAERAMMIVHGTDNIVDEAELQQHIIQQISLLRQQQPIGSSAGGEQPKFTAVVRDAQGQRRDFIIKFSDDTSTPSGRRWADLLQLEHLASEMLRRIGITSAETHYQEIGSIAYLEVLRFDRTPTGRVGVISLESIDDGIFGIGPTVTWDRVAQILEERAILTSSDALSLRVRYWFGRMIGNNDMHRGNVSFYRHDDGHVTLAPCYDMLPMYLRPTEQGTIVERSLPDVHTTSDVDAEIVEQLRPYVQEYWQQGSQIIGQ